MGWIGKHLHRAMYVTGVRCLVCINVYLVYTCCTIWKREEKRKVSYWLSDIIAEAAEPLKYTKLSYCFIQVILFSTALQMEIIILTSKE